MQAVESRSGFLVEEAGAIGAVKSVIASRSGSGSVPGIFRRAVRAR